MLHLKDFCDMMHERATKQAVLLFNEPRQDTDLLGTNDVSLLVSSLSFKRGCFNIYFSFYSDFYFILKTNLANKDGKVIICAVD